MNGLKFENSAYDFLNMKNILWKCKKVYGTLKMKNLKNSLIRILSFATPIAVLLRLYDLTSWKRCLILLCAKYEMNPKLLLENRCTKDKEIFFRFFNQYNSFNMCLVSEILGRLSEN